MIFDAVMSSPLASLIPTPPRLLRVEEGALAAITSIPVPDCYELPCGQEPNGQNIWIEIGSQGIGLLLDRPLIRSACGASSYLVKPRAFCIVDGQPTEPLAPIEIFLLTGGRFLQTPPGTDTKRGQGLLGLTHRMLAAVRGEIPGITVRDCGAGWSELVQV